MAETIRAFLKSEKEIPLYEQLESETLDKISLGEYNLAVLNAQRLFEIWTKHAVYTLLEEKYDEDEAERLMKTDDGEYRGIRQAIAYLDDHFGYDFRATEEYDRWNDAYEQIRCEVAHAEHMASNLEANEMYEACQEAQLQIHREFEEELKDTRLRLAKRDVPKNSFS